MPKVLRLPKRSDVKSADTWDLAPLCESDAQWEELFQKLDKQIAGFREIPRQAGRRREDAGGVPEVRSATSIGWASGSAAMPI